MTLFRSPRTAVHLVTVLEEMPVQETADGIAELRAAGLPVGGVVVNLVRPRDLDDDDLGAARAGTLDRGRGRTPTSTQAGVADGDDALVDGLLAEARDHAERRALEDAQRELVDELGVPTYELPRLAGGVDLGGLYELAAGLQRQGLAMTHVPRTRVGPPARRRPPTAPRLDVDALLDDPAHRHHRVLRLRRRRQDHHVRGARAAGGRARPQGRRADHRPGPPAGAVDGHRGARQHPAAGAPASTTARGRPRSTR